MPAFGIAARLNRDLRGGGVKVASRCRNGGSTLPCLGVASRIYILDFALVTP